MLLSVFAQIWLMQWEMRIEMVSLTLKAFHFPTGHEPGDLSDDAVWLFAAFSFFFFLSPFLAFTKLRWLITSTKLFSPASYSEVFYHTVPFAFNILGLAFLYFLSKTLYRIKIPLMQNRLLRLILKLLAIKCIKGSSTGWVPGYLLSFAGSWAGFVAHSSCSQVARNLWWDRNPGCWNFRWTDYVCWFELLSQSFFPESSLPLGSIFPSSPFNRKLCRQSADLFLVRFQAFKILFSFHKFLVMYFWDILWRTQS